MRTVLGVYTRTFWFRSVQDLLSRWTSSGTASGSVWNGSISSRVNARPIRTVLVRFHMEPFPCKRGLKHEGIIIKKTPTSTSIVDTLEARPHTPTSLACLPSLFCCSIALALLTSLPFALHRVIVSSLFAHYFTESRALMRGNGRGALTMEVLGCATSTDKLEQFAKQLHPVSGQ